MLAELERDFISERTKEGLRARVAKGTIQASMYDKDKDKILELYRLGVPINKIIATHLKYGKYTSLKQFIDRQIVLSS
jgi:DNA invertase Pin-like site-specific DNA recombinase